MHTLIRLVVILLLFPSIAFAACPAGVGSDPQVFTAVDATYAEVSDCVADAITYGSSAKVIIPSGTETWSTGVTGTLVADLEVEGAGVGVTNITSGSADLVLFTFTVSGTDTLTFSSMSLVLATANNTGGVFNVRGTSSNRILKNVYFNMTPTSGHNGRAVVWGNPNDATQGGGVVDNCTFYNNGTTGQGISVHGNTAGATNYWVGNPTWGTAAGTTYIENNIFNFNGGQGDGAFDAYSGSKIVFRYNTVTGTPIGWHGNDSSSGPLSVEIYKNTFTDPNNYASFSVQIRGGTSVIWDNTFDSNMPTSFTLSLYRSCEDSGIDSQRCDNTGGLGAAHDANTETCGYRCYQQPGSTGSDGVTQWPLIEWDNDFGAGTNNGEFDLNVNFLKPDVDCTNFDSSDHLVEGRDFINNDTCKGVVSDFCAAWWDDVNDKALDYSPYTYPHPLTVDDGLITVSNVNSGGLTISNIGSGNLTISNIGD